MSSSNCSIQLIDIPLKCHLYAGRCEQLDHGCHQPHEGVGPRLFEDVAQLRITLRQETRCLSNRVLSAPTDHFIEALVTQKWRVGYKKSPWIELDHFGTPSGENNTNRGRTNGEVRQAYGDLAKGWHPPRGNLSPLALRLLMMFIGRTKFVQERLLAGLS